MIILIIDEMKRGIFISFEGIDGSGKSTQIRMLSEHLKRRGIRCETTREPGGTSLSEEIRRVLLDNNTGQISPLSELFLYLASRREHLEKTIFPLLADGVWVISDRFTDSSVAYQGAGRGLPLDLVQHLNEIAVGDNMPDVTFYLDIAPKDALGRMDKENRSLDRLESEGLKFVERVREGYKWIAKTFPMRVRVVDATAPPDEIFKVISSAVDSMMNKTT